MIQTEAVVGINTFELVPHYVSVAMALTSASDYHSMGFNWYLVWS